MRCGFERTFGWIPAAVLRSNGHCDRDDECWQVGEMLLQSPLHPPWLERRGLRGPRLRTSRPFSARGLVLSLVLDFVLALVLALVLACAPGPGPFELLAFPFCFHQAMLLRSPGSGSAFPNFRQKFVNVDFRHIRKKSENIIRRVRYLRTGKRDIDGPLEE